MSKLSENVVLFSQGAYGCIFMDEVTVSKKNKKPVYVKKVQKRKETSDNEKEIGNIVKNINNYMNYFAPIEESSQLSLSSNDSNEIKKCEFITEEKKEFETNKIRFVGEHSLAIHLNLLSKKEKNANMFMETLLEVYVHLCEGVSKLNKKEIVHLDLKENNIIFDDVRKNPIIIDFGLSKKVKEASPRDIFFVYGPDYSPWCFDIALLTYICNELGENWEKEIIQSVHIEKVMKEFVDTNYGVNDLLSEEQKELLIRNMRKDASKYVNRDGKQVYNELINERYQSWDNYSLAVIFLYILQLMTNEMIENNEIVKKFRMVLINVIISIENRPIADETIKELYKEFSSNNKIAVTELTDELKKEFSPEKYNERSLLLVETKNKTEEKKK